MLYNRTRLPLGTLMLKKPISRLKPGMRLAKDVFTDDGRILCPGLL